MIRRPGTERGALLALPLLLALLPAPLSALVPAEAAAAAPAAGALPAQPGPEPGWRFADDAFADLWFHGLAVVGLYGFGPFPLYDASYALEARRERRAAGVEPTALETERARFLQAFQGDDTWEVLHFVPLWFRGAGRAEALRALRALAERPEGLPATGPATRAGVAAVGAILADPRHRAELAAFLDALEAEWEAVVAPRRLGEAGARAAALARLERLWREAWVPALADWLAAEGLEEGTVMTASALGAEGRFLGADPQRTDGGVVAVAAPDADPDAVVGTLGSLVRELCYPAVRRAFEPFEARVDDRVTAARVSDLAATRCGELLLERHLPERVAAYRARFGISGSRDRAFLATPGLAAGVAALSGPLEGALRRELNLDDGGAGASALPAGRH